MQEAMNRQLNAELYSSYLYLSMAAYFESVNLKGFSNWMKCQAQEELVHAMKFFSFLQERGGRAVMQAIPSPPGEWESPLKAFEDAYSHECKVSSMINELVDLALGERDHASNAFLQWFVNEQVEEEASTDAVVQALKLAGERSGGLFMLDRELSGRVFVMPTDTAA
jgi:ferritin